MKQYAIIYRKHSGSNKRRWITSYVSSRYKAVLQMREYLGNVEVVQVLEYTGPPGGMT